MVTYPASSVLAWSGAIRNTDPKGWRKNLTPANRSEGDPPAKEDHLSPQTLRRCPSSPREAHLLGVPYLLLISAPSGNISLTLRKEEWHSPFLSTLLSIPRPPGEKKSVHVALTRKSEGKPASLHLTLEEGSRKLCVGMGGASFGTGCPVLPDPLRDQGSSTENRAPATGPMPLSRAETGNNPYSHC